MLLQARGYEVVGVAEDIASGLAKAEELQPDCVLMDVNLPDGDGLSAAGAAARSGGRARLDARRGRDRRRRGQRRARLRPQGRARLAPARRTARPAVTPTRVVIAEDQALLRQGIVRLLGDAGFEVVAEAGDAPDLLRKVAAHKPDVAIVDVQMPPDNTDDGLRAAMEIRASQPDVGVLVLSQYAEERYAVDLIGDDAAGVGYLLKDRVTDFKLFADAVRRVAAGGSVLDPTVVAHMLGRRRRDDPLEAFTPREREVLELMAEGRSNKGIAEALVVTPHAVEKHVTEHLQQARRRDRRRRTIAACSRCSRFIRGESARG